MNFDVRRDREEGVLRGMGGERKVEGNLEF